MLRGLTWQLHYSALKMAGAMGIGVVRSEIHAKNKCDSSISECLNCLVLEKQLHGILEELESAKLIIKLIQQESDEDFPHDARSSVAINSPRDTSA